MPQRATKIVATLGPASSDPAMLEAMIRAGVNVVRLNFSHGTAQDHIDRATLVREAAQRAGREVGIMADLQGPKIRVGKFAEGKVMLEPGQPFVLDASRTEPGDLGGVGLDYKELPRDVKAGDTLLLNDGLIVMTVNKVVGPAVHTTVKLGGELSNNKGINKQGGGLTAPALTAKDMDDIKTAMGLKADYVAVSFPKNATDMELARQLCNVAGASIGHKPALIAKIERAEAIPELANILKVSDGIMVARGDLAVEVGNAAVPGLQKHMIRLAREMDKVVITATQMMESMIVNPVPTRAEVSDVANAVLDGTDAVMLSAETAAGKYPLETVKEMANICQEAEKAEYSELGNDFQGKKFTRIDQSIAMGALFTAHHLGAKAIVALTDSGSTALWMSRHNVRMPIYAVTSNLTSQRKMTLYRNVRPLLMDTSADRDTALADAEAHLKARGIVQSGDVYAITVGEPMGQPGGTNTLKICRAG
ncbi:MAG: pyruvate kinase [Gammaproteobacteria bacterium]|jgi:pyruvate kinase|uniref:pyruvate kinase n=1 Tax=Hydrogenophaga sp. TaxID=1904254 RepID=UPI0008D30DBE|nr:pyruvate kinase [Hydrogenophaga sp.]MBU4181325.1 pyruvate kinase [Gammaproteobacteria bacterium]OGB34059.1 MAG: pyruvate kinase [Burkholderiales bacterium RIFCSPLOWO2_02_FULL_66_35]PKO74480.1 MAG: pyruvate kinase [Betaproteobacteria bacterium HGW-Betaproteobacteria-15]MBU4279761.1 pyruvate kinase [Gammaproteobacteria bacterium]MBU4324534.1 pyruvate kinase [Gammaproteobacteria bacterium]